jgi:hypothetical protein
MPLAASARCSAGTGPVGSRAVPSDVQLPRVAEKHRRPEALDANLPPLQCQKLG